jgi:hypothetical protein
MLHRAPIDLDCWEQTFERWLASEEPMLREFKAPAMIVYVCGHRQPTNMPMLPYEMGTCLLCGPMRVAGVEVLDEPDWFPTPDALTDLEAI